MNVQNSESISTDILPTYLLTENIILYSHYGAFYFVYHININSKYVDKNEGLIGYKCILSIYFCILNMSSFIIYSTKHDAMFKQHSIVRLFN